MDLFSVGEIIDIAQHGPGKLPRKEEQETLRQIIRE